MATLAEDPVARFGKLMALSAAPRSKLAPDTLESVINSAGGDAADQVTAVATHVATDTPLTLGQARPLVRAAMAGAPDTPAKAQAVSEAVTAAGLTGNIELSDPVMLAPWARAVSGGLLFVALAACIACITSLGEKANSAGSALIGLSIVGVLALVGTLVLVMGYKNVTIKGGSSS